MTPENDKKFYTPFTSGSMVLESIDNRTWELREPVVFDHEDIHVTVPEGFITDLASVPRGVWSWLSPWDVARAAVIHDWLYSKIKHGDKTFTRKQADDIFLIGMEWADPEVPYYKCYLAWLAVRIFGGLHMKFTKKQDRRRGIW